MTIRPISFLVTKMSGQLPLRTVLILAFVSQILVAVGLTGWLTFRNGQTAINDLATRLRQEITQRVSQHLKTYLAMPHLVNQNNADAIRLGLLDITRIRTLDRYFYQQAQNFQSVNYLGLATAQGNYIGAQRRENGSTIIQILDNTATGTLETWETDNQGNRTHISERQPHYIPSQRPWYQAAVMAKQPVWSDIYVYFSGLSTTLSANQPVYDHHGQLLAVATADLTLWEISKFLNQLDLGKQGQTFILERVGRLVATSTGEKPYRKIPPLQQPQQLHATDSQNRITRATATYLLQHFGNLNQVHLNEQLDFIFQDQRHFLQIVPFQDPFGLDWLIVVVLPESDFMAIIQANTRATLILCCITLILAILSGMITAQWIAHPLHRLSQAAQQLANGQWNQSLPTSRQDEIGNLANSFQQMAEQLQLSFRALEKNNARLRENEQKLIQFLEAMPVGVFVFESNGRPHYANRLAQQLVGKGVISEATPDHLSEIYQAYLAGTPHLYPSHRLPGVRALWGESTQVDDIEVHHSDKIIPLEVRGTPIFDDTGQVIYALVAFQDITDRKQAQASQIRFTQELAKLNRQLEEHSKILEQKVLERTAALEKANQELLTLARSDGLTQIANRRHFDEVLRLEWNVLRREKLPLSLILCDVDYFKRYNDTYGHPAGDECLRQVAQVLRHSVRRPADLVARYGGEEFVVTLPNTSAEGAIHIATEIQKKVQQLQIPHAQSTVSHYVTLSFGIASLVPQPLTSPETLINLADHALYEAKRQGRNQIVLKS